MEARKQYNRCLLPLCCCCSFTMVLTDVDIEKRRTDGRPSSLFGLRTTKSEERGGALSSSIRCWWPSRRRRLFRNQAVAHASKMSLNICSKDVYDVCPAAGNKNETYFTIIVVRQTVDAASLTNEPAAAPLTLATLSSPTQKSSAFLMSNWRRYVLLFLKPLLGKRLSTMIKTAGITYEDDCWCDIMVWLFSWIWLSWHLTKILETLMLSLSKFKEIYLFSFSTLFIDRNCFSLCRIVYLENDLLDFHLKFHFIIARFRSKQSENHLEAQQ